MNKQVKCVILLGSVLLSSPCLPQESTSKSEEYQIPALFQSENPLALKISYDSKELRKVTNDSTYMDAQFQYQDDNGEWHPMQTEIRKGGHYRLDKCYYTPIKVKFKKGTTTGTLFKNSRKLKMVLPCLQERDKNDNVLKELMAYKLFERVSPYHFKTRMIQVNFEDQRGKKAKTHDIIGFFIEDLDKVAERHNANVLKRKVHPMQQDAEASIRNDFFQYMIGNTDFSNAYQHNERLLFLEGRTVPVPYDFDMSGLVNASYAVVSQIGDQELSISDVKQRLYRGFKRDVNVYQQVRKDFLDAQTDLVAIIDGYKPHFNNPNEFVQARDFLMDFFSVLADDRKFDREILDMARVK